MATTDTQPTPDVDEDGEIWYTPQEVAARFKICVSAVYAMIQRGEIPVRVLGRLKRIPGSWVNAEATTRGAAGSKLAPSKETTETLPNLFARRRPAVGGNLRRGR